VHDVVLKYRPIPWIPIKKTIRSKHPEAWHELSADQFAGVVEFLNKAYTKKDQTLLVNSLLSLKNPLDHFPEEVLDLHEFIKIKDPINDWVIKHLEIKGVVYHGPADQFRNVTIGEFAFADSYFINYLKTEKQEYLDKMLACYYRPENPHPDPRRTIRDLREPFNPVYTDENRLIFAGLDARLKAAIVFNYKNMRIWIQDQYTWVFPKATEEKKADKDSGGWREFVRSVVNGDYVHQEQILQTLMHTVLYDMNQNIKHQAKLKKK
jgi:hypothetical protein